MATTPRTTLSTLLLLLLGVVDAGEIHTNVEQGLEHPDITLDGWVLDEVFLFHPHEDESSDLLTLTRRKLQFSKHPHLAPESRRRLSNTDGDSFTSANIQEELSAVDASGTLSRDKVRGLAKLNFANQDHDWPYFNFGSWTNEMAKQGEMYYTENETLKEKGKTYPSPSGDLTFQFQKMIAAEADALASDITMRRFDSPAANWTAKNSAEENKLGGGRAKSIARKKMGIACVKFTHGNDVVLLFRDTESPGDNTNIESWITASVADMEAEGGMTQTMKHQWTEVAGLEWGEEQEERAAGGYGTSSNTYYKGIIQAAFFMKGGADAFEKDLAELSNGDRVGGDGNVIKLTKEQVVKQGYWPLTKQVVDQVRADLPTGGRLLFSGYSQGGGRAQLAWMYTYVDMICSCFSC